MTLIVIFIKIITFCIIIFIDINAYTVKKLNEHIKIKLLKQVFN